MIKNGTRLRSQVCETQVIVVRTSEALQHLRCGGAPMIAIGQELTATAQLDPALSCGSVLGKRYVDDSGAEVLVTKAGAGTLSAGSSLLRLKQTQPLPASD